MTDQPDDMAERAHDHLIERAAARMRNAARIGLRTPDAPAVPTPLPEASPGGSAAPAESARADVAHPPATPPVVPSAMPGQARSEPQPQPPSPPDDAASQALALPAIAEPSGGMPGLPARPEDSPELTLAAMERAGLVVGRSVRTRISEEFRIAVGRIARMSEQIAPNGVRNPLTLITSSRPGEGKSFTALNLAAVLAQNGPRQAVLVDTDFKQDGLTDLLGLNGRRGLYDVLDEDVPNPAALLVGTEVPRLTVMPAGSFVHDELAAGFSRPLGPRVEALAEAFRDRIIVLDAPPCLSTSDPSTLAGVAGQVVVVVEAGRTQRAEVEAALDFVKACPTVSVLLNKVRQSNRQTFGSYDYLSSYQ